MNDYAFFVPCVPPKVSHHHKKIIKRGKFHSLADKPELLNAKATLDGLFVHHQPFAPIGGDGPIVLDIELTWPWLKGDSKKLRALGRIPHDSKPDWDNAAKTLTDRLVALRFLSQDSRIVDGRVRKWRGDEPGIGISIRAFDAPATARDVLTGVICIEALAIHAHNWSDARMVVERELDALREDMLAQVAQRRQRAGLRAS